MPPPQLCFTLRRQRKTATRRSLLGLDFQAQRQSTVGGDHTKLLVDYKRGDMLAFRSADNAEQLQSALLRYLSQTGDAEVEAEMEEERSTVDQLRLLVGTDANADVVPLPLASLLWQCRDDTCIGTTAAAVAGRPAWYRSRGAA